MAVAMLRVVEREARVFRRMWYGSVFSSLVGPILFLAAMGLELGDLIDQRSGPVEGMTYLQFVTPGMLAAAAMQTAAGFSLWPIMAGTKWVRSFHGMVATPLSPGDIHAGLVVWAALRAALYGTGFFVVAALLGGVHSVWGVLAIPAAALCGAAFAAPLSAFAATQDTDLSFPVIMRLGILPLYLFSGTFFPIDLLPAWLQVAAVLSPLWHGVEMARAATSGAIEWWPWIGHGLVLAAIVVAALPWGRRAFARNLTP